MVMWIRLGMIVVMVFKKQCWLADGNGKQTVFDVCWPIHPPWPRPTQTLQQYKNVIWFPVIITTASKGPLSFKRNICHFWALVQTTEPYRSQTSIESLPIMKSWSFKTGAHLCLTLLVPHYHTFWQTISSTLIRISVWSTPNVLWGKIVPHKMNNLLQFV